MTSIATIIYIKKVLSKGFKFDDKVQVFYGNIHTVKGLTFDNVIVDETITKKDFYFTSLRLKIYLIINIHLKK